jgi:peptide/nickel transport system substrate-binding protein
MEHHPSLIAELSRRGFLRTSGLAMVGVSAALVAACSPSDGSSPSSSAAPASSSATLGPPPVDPDGVGGQVTDEPIAVLNWGLASSIPSLDLAKDFRDVALPAMLLALEPLLVVDQDLNLVPWLATMTTADQKELVFDLRSDATFSDGSPLTPEDVIWSWERHFDEELASQLSYFLFNFDSIKKTGANQVTITLKSPDPTFPYLAMFVHIHQKAFGEAAGLDLGAPGTGVMGTGPYTISDHSPDAGLTATARTGYWGTMPKAQSVKLQVITAPDTLRLALSDNGVAGTFGISLTSAKQLSTTENVLVGTCENSTSTFLSFPVRVSPFDDLNVRKAFAHCFDREGLVQALLNGGGIPATSVSTPNQWKPLVGPEGAVSFLSSLPAYGFDLAAAKASLDASAHAGGFTTSMKVPSDDPEFVKISQVLAENLKQIGVTLNIEQVSVDTYNTEVYSDKVEALWLVRLNPVVPDPTDYLGIILPTSAAEPGGYNFAYFSNKEVDELLTDQASQLGDARTESLKRVAQIAQEQLPYVPIYWPNYGMAINNGIRFNDFNMYTTSMPWAQNVGVAAT